VTGGIAYVSSANMTRVIDSIRGSIGRIDLPWDGACDRVSAVWFVDAAPGAYSAQPLPPLPSATWKVDMLDPWSSKGKWC
jgi:hypothetical protein